LEWAYISFRSVKADIPERAYQGGVRPEASCHSYLFSMNDKSAQRGIAPAPPFFANSLGDRQQIISVHTFVLADLVVCTYAAGINHNPALLVGFRVEQIVAFRAEME
jgi:hypothetical protein